jgi:membrane peptidoglycan carboxypeptidase
LRIPAAIVALLLIALVVFEVFAVWRAQQRTPEVLRRAAQGELQLADLSPKRREMLLKVEDPGFYRHKGFDASTPGQGRTNLTQSLVKRFYFENFQPGFAKIEQSLIARFVLDSALNKEGQLRAYLNHTYFGNFKGRPVIGFADAARTYFGRDFSELDDRQFLSLVAMLMAPNHLDPVRHAKENAERVRRIERMLAGRCAPTGVADVTYETC